jgi:hypothetical protein
MWEWAYAWARKQNGKQLEQALDVVEWQRLPRREEMAVRIEGRVCTLILWTFEAGVSVPLEHAVLPDGLCINESSYWGPLLHEAWEDGEAVQTGDLEFDLAFAVLGENSETPPRREAARRISPAVKASLLTLRPQLRDAYLFRDHLQFHIDGSRARSRNAKHPFAWALGRLFLGFDEMPNPADLQAGLHRAVDAARTLERACRGELYRSPSHSG